jgi:hypothetical protein
MLKLPGERETDTFRQQFRQEESLTFFVPHTSIVGRGAASCQDISWAIKIHSGSKQAKRATKARQAKIRISQ